VTRQERNLSAEDLRCLEHYAQGVNAFLQLHRGRLPIEFQLLRYQPSAWSPRDTLVLNLWIGKLLSTSWNVDLMRELIYKKLDRKLAEQLLVEFSSDDILVVGSDNHSLEKPISRLRPFSPAAEDQLTVNSLKIRFWEGKRREPSGVGLSGSGQPTPTALQRRGIQIFIARGDPKDHERLL